MTITILILIILAAVIGRIFIKTILTISSILLLVYTLGDIDIKNSMDGYAEDLVNLDYSKTMHTLSDKTTELIDSKIGDSTRDRNGK